MGRLADILMKLSPHDEHKLEANTEKLRRGIEKRERRRERAEKQGRDFIDMQLDIMQRK